MIVNQAFARRFYNGESPVGRRVMVWKRWYTIVGMVRNTRYYSLTQAPKPHFYLPFEQSYQQGQHIVFFVRTPGDPNAFIATLRNQAASVDPNAAGLIAAPLTDVNALLLLPLKFATSLLAVLGILALLLAAIGLYGVMSYSVTQQTKEISIRMALGAMPAEVLRAVFRQSMALTVAGLALGFLLALASMRLVGGLLVGVQPFDPLTFAAAALFLAAIAALASLLPARRATRVDPFVAMRSE
jgi:ABC-type antimicrobial peptide transport system permease subunit